VTKRNIADDEIALIKAMLARGMKNKDIQFFFNRPDRSVNSGRITGIRKGAYGGSNKIPPAPDAVLDTFIAKHPPTSEASAVAVPPSDAASDPLDPKAIRKLFKKTSDGTWRLAVGETDGHECKASFGMKHPQAWLRAIAALSNNSGGYIFFGVSDKGLGGDQDHVVIGLTTDDFNKIDPAALTKTVKSVFDPTPRFRATTISIGGKAVGVIHVERHDSRPVIATKQEGDKISEGDIFFRYPGQSVRIKYSDLRALLDARDKEARAQILPMVERLLHLGPQRSLVADLEQGTLEDSKTAIHIDHALVEKLTFIKEGEFAEVKGAPTLRLIGDVQAIGAPSVTNNELGLLTRESLLSAFLNQTSPANPELYIRFAIEVGQGEWLPLHYFAQLAGMTRAELVDFITSTSGTASRKTTYIRRAQPNAAYRKAVGKPKAIMAEIIAGKLPTVSNWQDASHVGQAIGALPDDAEFNRDAILKLLSDCLPLVAGKGVVSFFRRGICRVDELLFSRD
jgi:hypothetical protein